MRRCWGWGRDSGIQGADDPILHELTRPDEPTLGHDRADNDRAFFDLSPSQNDRIEKVDPARNPSLRFDDGKDRSPRFMGPAEGGTRSACLFEGVDLP